MPDQATAQAEAPDESSYRLPKTVVPERYELTLAPDLQAFTYTGDERVSLAISAPTNEILLNALDLDIHEATLTNAGGKRLTGTVTMLPEDERARIALERHRRARRLDPRPALRRHPERQAARLLPQHLQATPTAPSRSSPPPSSRRPTPAGRSRAGTSPTSRPSSRSPSSSTRACTAISNAARSSETPPGDGKQAGRRSPTPCEMSTYLVAFIVGQLEATEPVDVDGTPLRVVYVAGQAPPRRLRASRSAPSRCASSPTTTASRTRATSST